LGDTDGVGRGRDAPCEGRDQERGECEGAAERG
jgi:hypothetical protein